MPDEVRLAIIGAGAVSDYHHVPGIRIDRRARLVAVCDESEALLERRRLDWEDCGPFRLTTDYRAVVEDGEVDGVLIATPNFTHAPIALAATAAGKHVLCEKPLGLNFVEARSMYEAARDRGVRHMTAFTYRFAPSMRYLKHLVARGDLGEPRHFRSQRFLDLPETSWGWRQIKRLAGAGDLFDMTIHRIDLAQDLLGPIRSVCGAIAQFANRDRTASGEPCPPSEIDDWSSLIGVFASGAVGVWEGSTLMKGYHNDGLGHEWAEVNGSAGSAVYQLGDPNHILLATEGSGLTKRPVPPAFLTPLGSPRRAEDAPASVGFRHDLVYEFVSAIVEQRDAVPSFRDGALAQAVADAVLRSFDRRVWVDLDPEGLE